MNLTVTIGSIILAAIAALFSSASLSLHVQNGNLFVLLMFWFVSFVLFLLCAKRFRTGRFIVSTVFGSLFSLFCVLAKLDMYAESSAYAFLLFIRFLGLALFFSCVLYGLYSVAERFSPFLPEEKRRNTSRMRLLGVFAMHFTVLVLWFCIWMLFRFPGCLSPDSTWQLMQARGLGPLSNHHPIVHTMLIRLCINIGISLSGNTSIALAAYTVVQASMLAACFSYLIMTLYKFRVRLFVIAAIFLSFILIPSHAAISVTMLKDVWFSGFVLVLCTTLWRLMVSLSREGKAAVWDLVLLFISSLGMCIFRTNGLYVFLVFLPFSVCFFFKKNKLASLIPVLAFSLALVITGPLYNSLGIVPPDTIESLSIPAQHISRAVVEGAELSKEQYELLDRVMDVSAIPQTYTSWLSDSIKFLVRETGDQEYLLAHKMDFMRLWLDLGLQNPGAYLRAQIDLTCGYWYPKTDGTVIYPYFTEFESNTELCLLPAVIASFLASFAKTMPQLPVLKYLFSNGAAVWLCITLLGYCIAKKQYSQLLIFVPVLAIWFTLLIATPLDNEFRYAYSIFTTLPLLIVIPFSHVNSDKGSVTVR